MPIRLAQVESSSSGKTVADGALSYAILNFSHPFSGELAKICGFERVRGELQKVFLRNLC